MMYRTVLCALALGIDTGVAFQAPVRPSAGVCRTTPLKSTNEYYYQPETQFAEPKESVRAFAVRMYPEAARAAAAAATALLRSA